MPNMLAQLVLLSWPLVSWILFRKMRPGVAAFATVLLGYLFIPERVEFSVPVLPAISKGFLPALCAAVGLLAMQRHAAWEALRAARRAGEPRSRAPKMQPLRATRLTLLIPVLVVLLLAGAVLTWATNQTPLVVGGRYLPGLQPYDIGSMVKTLLVTLLPFWIGRRYLGDRETLIGMLKVLVRAGFAYSLLVLWEARMSPMLNVNLYGFFAHDWQQHVRDGAFRPIVFLGHGLKVGIFLTLAVVAAATLARADIDGKRGRWLVLTLWMFLCLYLSRNLGATMVAAVLVSAVLITSLRVQFLLGGFLAMLLITYPLVRGAGLVPATQIVEFVKTFNPSRGGSLAFRLENEDILMTKANQKPLAGWGGWGRSRVYDEETGRDVSTTDGSWVILIGTSGWIGYAGQFGLLCLPAIFLARRQRRYRLGTVEAGAVLILGANLVDLIPNASMTPVLWIWGGMLWGRMVNAAEGVTEARRARLGQRLSAAVVERRPVPERRSRPA